MFVLIIASSFSRLCRNLLPSERSRRGVVSEKPIVALGDARVGPLPVDEAARLVGIGKRAVMEAVQVRRRALHGAQGAGAPRRLVALQPLVHAELLEAAR